MRYDKGPLGALMDEYERAMEDFLEEMCDVAPPHWDSILDPDTKDEECKSAQSIARHTLFSGYSYANAIRKIFGAEIATPGKFYPTQAEFPEAMEAMVAYTEASIAGHWSMTDDEVTATLVPISWSDRYDLEGILEHAIVHILRHRRQVERLTSLKL